MLYKATVEKTMLYNSFFVLCNRAKLKSSKWSHRKTMHYNNYFMLTMQQGREARGDTLENNAIP